MNYSPYPQYELRRKFWKFIGAEITIYGGQLEAVIGFVKMKAFKLREDVRVYNDQSASQELLAIHARNIIDFGATYDVTDSSTGQVAFSLQRKGLRSAFVRDQWLILDPAGQQIGEIQETSGTLALWRRWLGMISDIFDLIFAFVVQTYEVRLGTGEGAPVLAVITHKKNPFLVRLSVDQSMAPAGSDSRLAAASATMLAIVDAAKN